MTDFNDLPPDELASARFDSELPEDVTARVDADPDMVARLADQAAASEFVATPPAPASEELRERHIAAALAAFDTGEIADDAPLAETAGTAEPTGSKPVAATPQADSPTCLLYTSPSPRDATLSRMPSSA